MNKKYWLGALAVISISGAPSAHAEVGNFMDDPARDLTRLNYYPHGGDFYFSPDVQYNPRQVNDNSQNASPTNDISTHSLQADMTLSYGLPWTGFRVGLTESWLVHRWADSVDGQTVSDGFSDPTFNVSCRVLDSVGMGFGWDAQLNVKPSWVTHQVATQTSEGSLATGYGTAELSSIFYYIDTNNDASLSLYLTHQFSGNGVNSSNPGASYGRGSATIFGWTLTDRYHFTRDLYGQMSLAFNFGYSLTEVPTNGFATPYQYPFRLTPEALIGYRMASAMTLDLSYTYQNYNSENQPGAAETNNMTQLIENNLELRARFEF